MLLKQDHWFYLWMATHPKSNSSFCKREGYSFASPPNTTYLTQLLDKGCFGPLKSYCKQACHEFYTKNPGHVITRFHFSSLFANAWHQAMTAKDIVASYSTTGVYPFNRNAPNLQKKSIFVSTRVTATTNWLGIHSNVQSSH